MDMNATIINTREMGLTKKMEKLPKDMFMDCLKAFSIMGLKIKANTRGAPSKSVFFIMYPIKPNKSMIKISTAL
jgi:hypothetical protein